MVQETFLTAEMHSGAIRSSCRYGVTCDYRYFLIVPEDTITLYPTVPRLDGSPDGDMYLVSEGRL
jgi:hypothetical protein